MMNASGQKKTNGTHIIVWRSAVAPENARWRLIRLAGEDRYDTALAIVILLEKNPYTEVALATGLNYPDALRGAILEAKRDIPLLLVGQSSVKESITYYLGSRKLTKAYVFGGESVISSKIAGK